MSEKKVVRYIPIQGLTQIQVGRSVTLNTVDHPDLSNLQLHEDMVTYTSTVVSIGENGCFETLNSQYVPVQQLNG